MKFNPSESLERESCLSLDDSVAGFVKSVPKGRPWGIWLVDSVLIESQIKSVVAALEGAIWMVEEVVAREPERQFLAFRSPERKVLEHRDIAVEVMGAGQRREDIRSLLARRSKWREASRVHELVRCQP